MYRGANVSLTVPCHGYSLRAKRRALACLIVGIVLAAPLQCFGAEAGSGAYWPGFRNYLAGVVPPPGFHLRNDLATYAATAPRVVLNGLPVQNVSTDVIADIVEPIYVSPKKLFGARHGIVLTQPIVWAHLRGTIAGTEISPSGNRLALADTVLSPLLLGWDRGKLHYNTNLAIFIPTGGYNVHRVVNTGRNFWAFDPQFAITHFDPETGWDLSAVVGYTFNLENHTTNYRSGNVLHVDYAFAKKLKNGVKPGIVGYVSSRLRPTVARARYLARSSHRSLASARLSNGQPTRALG